MTDKTPPSPEVQPPDVREQLHQENVTHEGADEPVRAGQPGDHMGANELEVTPIVPPMRGPGNLVGRFGGGDRSEDAPGDEEIDPVDEITPG